MWGPGLDATSGSGVPRSKTSRLQLRPAAAGDADQIPSMKLIPRGIRSASPSACERAGGGGLEDDGQNQKL